MLHERNTCRNDGFAKPPPEDSLTSIVSSAPYFEIKELAYFQTLTSAVSYIE